MIIILKPLQRMQKTEAIRLITFSNFDAHTSLLFAQLRLLKLQDHIKLRTLYFMHQFGKLPKTFDSFFFIKTSDKHNVNTRFSTRSTFMFQQFEQTMVNSIFDTIVGM